jgi:trypsin
MKKTIFIFALTLFSVHASDKVVGGADAKIEDWPFIVSVERQCGGTIINSEWVLTAAHCEALEIKTIYAGDTQLRGTKMKAYEVEKVFVHPLFVLSDESAEFDVALLKLKTPIDFVSSGLRPIGFANQDFDRQGHQKPGTVATVLGWGHIGHGWPAMYPTLQRVDVPIVSYDDANLPEAYDGIIDPASMLPAGYKQGGKDACSGDSGGPLVIKDKVTEVVTLVGVVSWGDDCAKPSKYGIYAKVSEISDWVKETIR